MLTFRAPAYVGVGGLGGAVLSAFLQAASRPPPASPLAAPGGLYPAAAGPQETCSEPLGPAPHWFEDWPPSNLILFSAGLGAFLLIFGFVLGVIVGGCGGFCLGYLWSSAGRSASRHYGWPRVARYVRPPGAALDRRCTSSLHREWSQGVDRLRAGPRPFALAFGRSGSAPHRAVPVSGDSSPYAAQPKHAVRVRGVRSGSGAGPLWPTGSRVATDPVRDSFLWSGRHTAGGLGGPGARSCRVSVQTTGPGARSPRCQESRCCRATAFRGGGRARRAFLRAADSPARGGGPPPGAAPRQPNGKPACCEQHGLLALPRQGGGPDNSGARHLTEGAAGHATHGTHSAASDRSRHDEPARCSRAAEQGNSLPGALSRNRGDPYGDFLESEGHPTAGVRGYTMHASSFKRRWSETWTPSTPPSAAA